MPVTTNTIALGLSYNGADYRGWQLQQASVPTVQAHLERALSLIANEQIRVTCAGRTDSGVHATRQIVHFSTSATRPSKAWVMGTNSQLPDSISICWSQQVTEQFSARHNAIARRYFYLVHNHKIRSALFPQMITREIRALDVQRMHEAGQHLLGENDFSSFRAASCQSRTPMRNIHHLNVTRKGELVIIDIQANAFLHHMVRNITGVLLDIGACEKPVTWTQALLRLRDRGQAAKTAPPNGLYLIDVIYPDDCGIPAGPTLPHILSLLDL